MIQTVENIGEKLVSMLTYDASQPLIFSSGLFLFLFAGFLFFYGFTRRAPMARIVYVILFSLYFYYKSSGIYFLLLVFASVSDYWIAHAIYKVRTQRAKYWLVGLSVLVNLGMLGYFKYTNFLIEIANNLFGQGFLNFQNIFLPVGISFFVFQSMSYTIDICRGQLKPLNNWADYLFYLSFFPQLVAGPIVRAKDFIPQIRQNPLRVTREMFGMGVFLILIGLFKKAVISDYISLNFVDRIFDEPLLYSGFECLMGIYGYALQIYCDFSGYSDLAETILPQLRRSRLTANIEIIGKSDDEISALAKSNPSELNIEEILYAATLTNNDAEKMAIYTKASELYPNCYRTWNNIGMMAFRAGDLAKAEQMFNKSNSVKANPEANMNLGLIALTKGDQAKAQQLFGSAAGVAELGEALGVLYLEQGEWAKAANSFGSVKSNNAALAQILTKDYSKASQTLNAVAKPDATTSYLKAIVAARTNDANAVISNLKAAIAADKAMAKEAAIDLEFAKYATNSEFAALVK